MTSDSGPPRAAQGAPPWAWESYDADVLWPASSLVTVRQHHQISGEMPAAFLRWHCFTALSSPANATSSGPSTSLPSFLSTKLHRERRSLRQLTAVPYRTVLRLTRIEILGRTASTTHCPLPTAHCPLHAACNQPSTSQGTPRPRPSGSRPREPRTKNPDPGLGSSYLPGRYSKQLLQPGREQAQPVGTGDSCDTVQASKQA